MSRRALVISSSFLLILLSDCMFLLMTPRTALASNCTFQPGADSGACAGTDVVCYGCAVGLNNNPPDCTIFTPTAITWSNLPSHGSAPGNGPYTTNKIQCKTTAPCTAGPPIPNTSCNGSQVAGQEKCFGANFTTCVQCSPGAATKLTFPDVISSTCNEE